MTKLQKKLQITIWMHQSAKTLKSLWLKLVTLLSVIRHLSWIRELLHQIRQYETSKNPTPVPKHYKHCSGAAWGTWGSPKCQIPICSGIHEGPTLQLKGPKGSTANVPLQGATGHPQRFCIHPLDRSGLLWVAKWDIDDIKQWCCLNAVTNAEKRKYIMKHVNHCIAEIVWVKIHNHTTSCTILKTDESI